MRHENDMSINDGSEDDIENGDEIEIENDDGDDYDDGDDGDEDGDEGEDEGDDDEEHGCSSLAQLNDDQYLNQLLQVDRVSVAQANFWRTSFDLTRKATPCEKIDLADCDDAHLVYCVGEVPVHAFHLRVTQDDPNSDWLMLESGRVVGWLTKREREQRDVEIARLIATGELEEDFQMEFDEQRAEEAECIEQCGEYNPFWPYEDTCFTTKQQAIKALHQRIRSLLKRGYRISPTGRVSDLELERFRVRPLRPSLMAEVYHLEEWANTHNIQEFEALHRASIDDLINSHELPVNDYHVGDVISLTDYRGLGSFIVDCEFPMITWNPQHYHSYPQSIQSEVFQIMLIRSNCSDSLLAALPIELIFELFGQLTLVHRATDHSKLFLYKTQTEYGYVPPPRFRPPFVPDNYFYSHGSISCERIEEDIEYNGPKSFLADQD